MRAIRWLWVVALACGSGNAPRVSSELSKQLVEAWQGTWVLPDYEAIEIKARAVALYYNGHIDKGTLEFDAPCRARLRFKNYAKEILFAYDSGKLLVGAHGARIGDGWFVCTLDAVAVTTPKGCRVRGVRGASCTLTPGELEIRLRNDRQIRLRIEGNVAWPVDDSPPREPVRATSFEAAQKYSDDRGEPGTAGGRIVNTKGCVACHSLDGSAKIGPSFKGLFGSTADGVTVDDAHIRESIREPNAKVRAGFPPTCVKYTPDVLDDYDVAHIVAFLKTLR